MAEPTLSEIQGYTGNAGLGSGEAGMSSVVLPADYGIQYLNQAAAAKAELNKFTYLEFQKNLKDYMTNFNEIDVNGVMNNDYDALGKEYGQVSKMIVDNYDIIRNPNKDLAKYAEITQAEKALRTKIAQSKMQKGLADKHREFINTHPDWNTPENQELISGFESAPLEKRQQFNFSVPRVYDNVALGKTIADLAAKKYATSNVTADGKYIYDETGVKYDDKTWNDTALSIWNGTDKFTRTIKSTVEWAYNNLPQEEKAKYASTEDFYLKTIVKPQDQVTQANLKAEPYKVIETEFANNQSLSSQRFRQDLTKMAKAFEYDKALQKMKDELKIKTDTEKGEFINTETAKIFESGHNSKRLLSSPVLGGEKEKEINNISPKYAKLFGYAMDTKFNGMSTNKSIWIEPDGFSLTKDGNLRTIFFQRDDMGNIIKSGGKNLIDQDKTNTFSPDQVRATLATITTSSNIDDVISASNKALLRAINSESLDGANLDQYTKVKGLGGAAATGGAGGSNVTSITITKEHLANPESKIYTLPDGSEMSLKDLMKNYSKEDIEKYLKTGVIK